MATDLNRISYTKFTSDPMLMIIDWLQEGNYVIPSTGPSPGKVLIKVVGSVRLVISRDHKI